MHWAPKLQVAFPRGWSLSVMGLFEAGAGPLDRTYHTDAHKKIQYSGRVFTVSFSLLLNGLVAFCPARSEHLLLREPRLEIL